MKHVSVLFLEMEHAKGAFLGALVGDAAGATLEFVRKPVTQDMALHAMTMPGGGVMNVGKGQITDDGELALCLAEGLTGNSTRSFPRDDVAKMYVAWYDSNPFDMGTTCRRAFGMTYHSQSRENVGQFMQDIAMQHNTLSEANGALMRVVPLAIWSSHLPMDRIATLAAQDALLSHPSQVCQDCNKLYCIAVATLVRHPKNFSLALKRAEAYAEKYITSSAKGWLMEDSHDVSGLNCTINIGHVKYAFILAFHHLRKGSTFEAAMLETLQKGGDTDTNAAIVGGMMGALHGVAGIPNHMKDPVLSFDCTKKRKLGHVRNTFFNPNRCMQYADILMTPSVKEGS